ncbi:hypothetical protein HMPREF0083_04473 [Aneurinibacillus aneurinilyticus ATCC 12856]|uniref:Uncharacterized protein n=1 Tax=Aneurinibacillus aneurinilyticus ATCC 12856 TaxID=649747 RepID=U1WYU4_ANEAE|nr:hypothetical protein HMPREF0083_04473 [Aneurinibacillus aneurinilyticus ATCC 12856]
MNIKARKTWEDRINRFLSLYYIRMIRKNKILPWTAIHHLFSPFA